MVSMTVADWSFHIANAYVSGMKEEINVVGNEYQTFTTMWTMYATAIPDRVLALANASKVAMS
jgi:hypothetical protein